jgi:hypothetical protein
MVNAVAQKPTTGNRKRGAPLLSVNGVSGIFDFSHDRIRAAIDCGDIVWSWNIALHHQEGMREIRILMESARDFWMGKSCLLKWPDVLKLLLPHDGKFLTTPEIVRCLNIDAEYLRQLSLKGILKPISPGRRGPTGARQYSTEQFVSFLKERRL